MLKYRSILSGILLFLILLFGNVTARDYYVAATGGSDSNPGTISAPYNSFAPALQNAVAGETIYARGGTYDYDNSMIYQSVGTFIAISNSGGANAKNGVAGNPITIRNQPGETPILDLRDSRFSGAERAIYIRERSFWTIQGFEIIDGMIDLNAGSDGSADGTGILVHDIIIKDNHMHDYYTSAGSNEAFIRVHHGGVVSTTGTNGAYNIFIWNNIFHHMLPSQGASWDTSEQSHFGALGTMSCQQYPGYGGMNCGHTGYIEFINNTVYNMPQAFHFKNPSIGPVLIRDNTIYNVGVVATLNTANVNFTHNLFYNINRLFIAGHGNPGAFYDARLYFLDGWNATVDYNTFIGLNDGFYIRNPAGHRINNNVFFGLPLSPTGYVPALAYKSPWTGNDNYPDSSPIANSIFQTIKSDYNCFIVSDANFNVAAGYVGSTTDQRLTISQARTQLGWDVNSRVIVQTNPSAIFVNPTNRNYDLITPSQCPNMGYYAQPAGPDTTPPIISSGLPSGILAYGTTSAILSVTTNEVATCKYSSSDQTYSSMPYTFSTTGSYVHSQTLSGLQNGLSYSYYVRCQDSASNPSVSSTLISFSIATASDAPAITNVASSSITSSAASISWTTNINSNSTVRYGTTSGNYPNSAGINDNVQSHSVSLTGLTAQSTYYFVVLSCNGLSCTTSPQSSFTTQSSLPSSRECPTNWQTLHPEWIFCDDFENNNLGRWDETGIKNTVTSNVQNIYSGSYALQALFDTTGSGGENLIKWFMPGVDEAYIRFYVKFQTGFQNIRSDGDGMHLLGIAGNRIDDQWSSFGHAGTVPTGTDRFTTAIDPYQVTGSPILRPFIFYTYWPDMSCAGGCWGNVFQQTAPQTPLTGGQWQLVEARIRLNTPGLSDGLQQLFIDNVQKISVQNMRWRDTTDLRINDIGFLFYMPNTIGTQYIYVDNVVVSRNPVGPYSGQAPTSAPVISALQNISTTSTSTIITWNTDISSNTTLRYGTVSGTYPNSAGQNDYVSSHSVTLSPLSPSTTYYYVAVSCNSFGCTTSPQSTFRTSAFSCTPGIIVDSTYVGYSTSVIDNGVVNAQNSAATWSTDESSTTPHWIQRNYCTPTTLNNATIWWAFNTVRSRYETSQTIQVQYSNDGASWQTAANMPYPGANQPISSVSFSPNTASYWRLYQPANQGSVPYPLVMWLTEIELSQTSITGDSTPPAAITNIASTNLNPTNVTLTWTSPGDDSTTGTATSYDLRYSNSQITAVNFNSASQVTAEPTPSIAGTSQSLTITGLTAQSTYYFAIKTLDEVPNTSPISNIISFTTPALPDTTNPSVISDLAATSSTPFTITLNWTAPGDDGSTGTAALYDLRYSTSTITASNFISATQVSGEPIPTVSNSRQSMVISGLNPSTTYYFAIKAIDEVGNTAALSNIPSRATLPGPDTVAPSVTNPQPTGTLSAGTTQTTISVTTDEAATCRYSTTSNSPFTSMTQFTTTGVLTHSRIITGLQNGQSYNYYVRCNDTSGNINGIDAATISFGIGVPPDVAPSVYLNSPTSGFQTFNTSITLNCSATDDNSLTNLNLYTDISGSWELTQSRIVSGTSTTQLYTLNSVPTGNFKWNCLAIDSSGKNSTYATNFTFQVLPAIYDFTLSPTIDSMQILPNSQQNSSITINNTGNQNLTLTCATSQSFATINDCPTILQTGQYIIIKAGINSATLTTGIYPVALTISQTTPTIIRNSSLIVNVTSTPTYPTLIISQINSTTTHQSAIISWLTDHNSNSSVNYGLTTENLNAISTINDNVQSHSISLASLIPSMQYFFTVTSCDLGGCQTSSIQTFNTTSTPVGCTYNNPPCQSGFSCQINLCVANYVPPVSSGSSGGASSSYTGPSTDINTKPLPSPSIKASVKPSATIPPSVQFITIKSEIETSLPDLTIEGQDEIQQLLDEAERLQKTGNTQQALVLLNRAKSRLNDLKTKKADYPWQLGLIGLTVLIGVGIYYFKTHGQTKT